MIESHHTAEYEPELTELVTHAAEVVDDVLAIADSEGDREEAIVQLNDELSESGVMLVSVHADENERKGRTTNLTREQLLDAIDIQRTRNRVRTTRRLGYRAIL